MSLTNVRRWSSHIWAMLLSALSWMHWLRRRRLRIQLEAHRRQLQQEQWLRQELRTTLLEALTPLAEALHRLDNRQKQDTQAHRQLVLQLQAENRHLEELLMEVLNSQQPTAHQQLLRDLNGQRMLPSSYRGWVS